MTDDEREWLKSELAIDDPSYAECPSCGNEAQLIWHDEGFDYEYGSEHGYREDWRLVTDCCQIEL
ncbi:hypothetical protein [Photobacterium halotolerans]|uniref:hypothetical protein n=1 Tax=Photobacterium halotolerans TaxID=265726 RepID=UPI00042A6537|nr:hypothetical protein [Photobacterium halotolerans]